MPYQFLPQNYLAQIIQANPLIHCMTNIVVANYTANGLLAIGASPIMADAKEEMADLAQISTGLVINIGTLDQAKIQAMLLAGKAANVAGIPVVLDPVGVGATSFRQTVTHHLLQEIKFTAIRGNAGELAYLAGMQWNVKGVDAGQGDTTQLGEIAKKVAQKYQCIAAVSGKVDYVSDGKQVVKIKNGTLLFPRITGSGCLLGAVIAAFLSVKSQSVFDAVIHACTTYAVAGEIAGQSLTQTQLGQFYTKFLDQLAEIDDLTVYRYAQLEIL